MDASEEMPMRRLHTIALMAATMYAGDRIAQETHNASDKSDSSSYDRGPNFFQIAKDASALYTAVENHEYPTVPVPASPVEHGEET